MDTDTALDIFGLDRTYSIQDLVAAYKRVSRMVHPDKGGSKEMFGTVMDCYTHLLDEHKYINGGTPHHDMKKEFRSQVEPLTETPKRFNISEFNSTFEETCADKTVGYGDFLKSVPDSHSIMPERVSTNNFQSEFNSYKRSVAEGVGSGQIITRPVECGDLKSTLQFTEMGVEEIDDFSVAFAGVHGSDCKLAYTEDGFSASFVDANNNIVNHKEVSDYERSREFNFKDTVQKQEEHYWKQKSDFERQAQRTREIMRRQDQEAAMRASLAANRLSNI